MFYCLYYFSSERKRTTYDFFFVWEDFMAKDQQKAEQKLRNVSINMPMTQQAVYAQSNKYQQHMKQRTSLHR